MLLKGSSQGRVLPTAREFQNRRCTRCIRYITSPKTVSSVVRKDSVPMYRFRTRKANRAFTLVELLVVVLILAILMAVALPLYLGAIRNSEKGAARANMQTIANANQSYRLQNAGFTANMALLAPDLGTTTGLTGPGTRTYLIDLLPTTACDHDGNPDNADVAPAANTPFLVRSIVQTDGCFIPGQSPR